MAIKFVQVKKTSLLLPLSDTETSLIRLRELVDGQGNALAMSDFGDVGRLVLNPGGSKQEIIEFTDFTVEVDGTISIDTGIARGRLPKSPYGAGGTAHDHSAGTVVIAGSAVPQLFDELKDYIDSIVIGALGNASTETAGTVRVTSNDAASARANSVLVSEQATPNMTLKVSSFGISTLDQNISYAGGNTGTMTAPVTNPRIDLVVYVTGSASLAVRTGTEGASPSEPTPSNGDIVLCSVYHRVGETSIREIDESPNTQGYIKKWYTPSLYSTNVIPSGSIQDFGMATLPTGWLECDGAAVSRTTYSALFAAIGTTWGSGDGSTTFNVPDLRGRNRVNAGTGTKVATFASRSSNVITVTGLSNKANNEFQTGQAVTYSTTGSVITGLSNDTVYYVIRTGNLTFSLATSLANAQAGTAISLSSDGSGVQTFTLTLTERVVGETGGEENHAMSMNEMIAHNHPGSTLPSHNSSGGMSNGYLNSGSSPSSYSVSVASQGGNQAMNNMQPFGVIKTGIKI